ncbi:unnamed protein product [Didymodactylos carnosus]|uniref:PPM-type phosphatase domain-containing protein n=2 Tax=Didymodactylos carnosus TaxID=1234261 RepID=A0A813VPB4_9BILA|nr:unnamed protein product [Didymodactylos carnosus]CAF3630461.1 unnamed protein product [Didymodactylos carnosus]
MISFNTRNDIIPYRLYSNRDFSLLPNEPISQLLSTTFATYTGPDVGFIDIAPHQKRGILKVDNTKKIAGHNNWQLPIPRAYGVSTSLYDQNPITKELNGEPIADCFAICARENNCILCIADGVNWGYKPRLAARCAVNGAMTYLNQKLYTEQIQTTEDIFTLMKKAIDSAQRLIIDREGSLTTLCISVVCQTRHNSNRFFVCTVSVGDSNSYVYSKKHGVLELTEGTHDINNERDMRHTGGALGFALDDKADLSNLAYSLMEIQQGDFVYLTTDGISDNYDPVVSGVARSAKTPLLQRKSFTEIETIENNAQLMNAYERHLCHLHHMTQALERYKTVEDKLSAQELCAKLLQHTVNLTHEQRTIIENSIRERENEPEGGKRDRFTFEEEVKQKLVIVIIILIKRQIARNKSRSKREPHFWHCKFFEKYTLPRLPVNTVGKSNPQWLLVAHHDLPEMYYKKNECPQYIARFFTVDLFTLFEYTCKDAFPDMETTTLSETYLYENYPSLIELIHAFKKLKIRAEIDLVPFTIEDAKHAIDVYNQILEKLSTLSNNPYIRQRLIDKSALGTSAVGDFNHNSSRFILLPKDLHKPFRGSDDDSITNMEKKLSRPKNRFSLHLPTFRKRPATTDRQQTIARFTGGTQAVHVTTTLSTDTEGSEGGRMSSKLNPITAFENPIIKQGRPLFKRQGATDVVPLVEFNDTLSRSTTFSSDLEPH